MAKLTYVQAVIDRLKAQKTGITIPAFTHLVTVRKTKYTDDDVAKGTRYFYRIRGINSKGAGEWSEPVSRVQ